MTKMLVSCDCLNVGILIEDLKDKFTGSSSIIDDVSLDNTVGIDPFFAVTNRDKLILASVKMYLDGSNRIEKVSAFVDKRAFNSWSIKRCLLCDTDVYASCISCPGRVYVNSALILNEMEATRRKNLPNYSLAFDVVIPTITSKMMEDNKGVTLPPILVHSVNQVITQRLRKDRCDLEQRIQAFADAERAKFEQYKAKSKAEESALLYMMAQKAFSSSSLLISAYGSGSGGNDGSGDRGNATTPIDELYDSGVPVSPLSLQSAGGYSPISTTGQQQFPVMDDQLEVEDDGSQVFSTNNKPSLVSTKRKRHSGGKGKPPSLNDRWYKEQLQEVFNLEEQEDDVAMDPGVDTNDQFDENYAADESSDSDNFQKLNAIRIKSASGQEATALLCRSLPVAIADPKTRQPPGPTLGANDNEDDFVPEPGANLAESMMALSRSMRPRDDPEMLFGNRPNRRRFRSNVDPPVPPLDPVIDVEFF